MRQVFPTLKRAREVSHPKPADPWGFSREAQDHGYRSHVSVSLGLLADYLAAHTIVLLGLAPSVFPIDTLLSGEFHNKKKEASCKKLMDFHCYPSQGSHIWGIVCACYGRVDGDAGRVDTFLQLPFPLPTKLFVAMSVDWKVKVFRQGIRLVCMECVLLS